MVVVVVVVVVVDAAFVIAVGFFQTEGPTAGVGCNGMAISCLNFK